MNGGLTTPLAERILDWLRWPAGWDRAWAVGVVGALIILVVTIVVGWLLKNVVINALRRVVKRTATDLDDKILALAERPSIVLVWIVGLYLGVTELPFPDKAGILLSGVLLIAVVLVTIRVATRVSVVLLLAYGRRVHDDSGKQRFEKDYVPLVSKVIGTAFILMGLISVLHHFGQDVSSVVAALGIGGLAISFAAKDTLGNMFAGFTILLDRPFRPGDRIKLATGEIGDVLEVGTRSTRLRLIDENMLIVPNSELVNTRVVNFNFPSHSTRASIEVGVAYGADVEKVKKIILDAIASQPEVLPPPPVVLLTSFGDSALMFASSYVVAEYADAGLVQDRVRVRVYTDLQAAKIKIPYPTRELIHVGSAPAG